MGFFIKKEDLLKQIEELIAKYEEILSTKFEAPCTIKMYSPKKIIRAGVEIEMPTAEQIYDYHIDDLEFKVSRFTSTGSSSNLCCFSLNQLPGCCGVALSYGMRVGIYNFRKGVATILQPFKIELAKTLGYSLMLCTDVETNEPQRKILQRNGWKDVFQFKNRRTNNTVNVSVLKIWEEESKTSTETTG